jgi:hypothetical protein
MLPLRRLIAPVLNSVTDPSVLFNTGNTINALRDSAAAAVFTASAGALCLILRLSAELAKNNIHIPLPQKLKKMTDQPSFALGMSGGLLVASGAATAAQTADISNPNSFISAAIPTGFGVCNILLARARALRSGSLPQKLCDVFGQTACTGSLLLASQGAPWPVQATFALSPAAAMALAARGKESFGPLSPNTLNMAGSLACALTLNNNALALATLFWALGYGSLQTLYKGGLVEFIEALFQKNQPVPPAPQNPAI